MSTYDNFFPSVDPDEFTGSDSSKVQSAIFQALSDQKPIVFKRIFDIGTTEMLVDKYSTVIEELQFLGMGGGIKVTSGYMFTAYPSSLQSGIKFVDMIFQGSNSPTVQCGIFSQSHLFTDVVFESCIFDNIDTAIGVTSGTQVVHGYSFIGCKARSSAESTGSQPFINGGTIHNLLVENCEFYDLSTFMHVAQYTYSDGYNVTIRNNKFENIKDTVISSNISSGMIIDDNLFLNSCYQNPTSYTINLGFPEPGNKNGIMISNNTFKMSTAQKSSEIACINLDNMEGSGVTSINNKTDGVLYKISTASPGTSHLISMSDYSSLSMLVETAEELNYVRFIGKSYDEGTFTVTGNTKVYRASGTKGFEAGEFGTIEVEIPISDGEVNLNRDDIIIFCSFLGLTTVQDIFYQGQYVNYDENKVYVNMVNTTSTSQNISVEIKVIRILK